jgi:hypothetical protein
MGGLVSKLLSLDELFKARHFDAEIIVMCVRWYLAFKLSYRDLAEMMAERGVSVAPSTILRWVQHYAPGACEHAARGSFSPLTELLSERTTPELQYLQTKWASLMSYGMTVDLLKDVLPISDDLSKAAIRNGVERVAQRLDGELGDERNAFIEGTPLDWQQLPDPAGPLTVGIDGGYVHACNRKGRESWFEVIVGNRTG